MSAEPSQFSSLTSSVQSFIDARIIPLCRTIWDDHKPVLATLAVIGSAIKLHHFARSKRLRLLWNSAGRDVVVLHLFPRATTCPNLSPFVLKLETYLRMANIQYKTDFEDPIGPKGKCPWITLNGKDYSDSQLIMEFLGGKYGKCFSSHLSDGDKATARALLIMADEHSLWGIAWWRMTKDQQGSFFDLMSVPWYWKLLSPLIRKRLRGAMFNQGFGRHSEAEKVEIIRKNFEAFSLQLGKKPFMMGNEACEVDCSVFGILSQCLWGLPGSPFEEMVKNDYPNLVDYCMRMKEKFWPDWEQLLSK